MKEMIYSAKRLNPPEMLADGEYKGLHFYVLNLGTHPCAYVDVTDTDLNGKHYDDIDVECHYGLTYSEKYLRTVDKEGWFIGWDYGHYCDFAGYELEMPIDIRSNGKRWTTAEIVNECKQVIDQLALDHQAEKGKMFKLLSEDSVLTTYGKWHENDRLTFFFNKELEQVDIEYQIFERNADCYFVPQGENGHSCKYGHWRIETPCLSMEDIEFLYSKSKEIFGYEKGGEGK